MPALMPKLPPMSAGTCSRIRGRRQAQRAGHDRHHGERAVEVGPRLDRRAVGAVAPVGDHRVALHRHRRVAREVVLALDHVRGGRERLLHGAEGERPVGGDVRAGLVVQQRGVGRERRARLHDDGERLVVDRDQLGGVLGGVPVRGHDHRDRLADEAHLVGARRVVGHRPPRWRAGTAATRRAPRPARSPRRRRGAPAPGTGPPRGAGRAAAWTARPPRRGCRGAGRGRRGTGPGR